MAQDSVQQESMFNQFKGYLLTGLVFVVPAVVTVGLTLFILQFLLGYLQPVSASLGGLFGLDGALADFVILVLIVAGIVLVGAFIETIPHGGRAAETFHHIVETIPGFGQVYGGFREMSQTIASGEESFRDVKLVEYPSEGSYTMAFVTADTPSTIEEQVGHTEEGMVSLFMPMGPNPIMGGFVIYVARDRVYDIDLSVEEGLQAIITSGVTVGETKDAPDRPQLLERFDQ